MCIKFYKLGKIILENFLFKSYPLLSTNYPLYWLKNFYSVIPRSFLYSSRKNSVSARSAGSILRNFKT